MSFNSFIGMTTIISSQVIRLFCTIVTFVFLISCISCDGDHVETDSFGIDRKELKSFNAVTIETYYGAFLISDEHGYVQVVEGLPDSLSKEGLKLNLTGYIGYTYQDERYKKDITYFDLESATPRPDLYSTPPLEIRTIWSPDWSEHDGRDYPDGYGYRITINGNGGIRQPDIPGMRGIDPFKTEIEAYKVGLLVAHRMVTIGGLPATTISDLDILLIDYSPI